MLAPGSEEEAAIFDFLDWGKSMGSIPVLII